MNAFWKALGTNVLSIPATFKNGLRAASGDQSDGTIYSVRRNFVYHLHPLKVRERSLRLTTTFGLGLITMVLFGVLVLSGLLLMVYYVPSPKLAHGTMEDLQYAVTFGAFVRSLHRLAAHAMVLSVALHLIRVFLHGAYGGRPLNWLIGVALFSLTILLAFTGYLLPWDQLSYWAVNVSAGLLDQVPLVGGMLKSALLGSDSVGQRALIRFYTLHVALLPGVLTALMVWHVWRIRKDGGLAVSKDSPANKTLVSAMPDIVLREIALVLFVILALAGLSIFYSAPLGLPPDMHRPSNPEKTPWYFLWLQEMVSYSAPVGGFGFPLFLGLGLLLVPLLDRTPRGVGKCPEERTAWGIVFVASIAIFVLLEILYNSAGFVSWLGDKPVWVLDLVNPATGMIITAMVAFFSLGTIHQTPRVALLGGATVLVVAVAGFGLMGFCRGPDWVFFWPWEVPLFAK